jgi:microcystin-dependent protein
MSDPFIGEIRTFGFNFAPRGWFQCNGQLLPISGYSPLFAIIGTTYGGNGTTNFALPNMQCQVPMHWGTGPSGFSTVLGEVQGTPSVTLMQTQIPLHTHTISVAALPPGPNPERSAGPNTSGTSYIAESGGSFIFQSAPATPNTAFSTSTILPSGSTVPHENRQPFLAVNFCIAYEGVFPTRN